MKALTKKQMRKQLAEPPAIAHIVPRTKVAAAKRGEDVFALCGAKIVGEPKAEDAPVCLACFMKQLEADDTRTDKASAEARTAAEDRARQRYEAGQRSGVDQGRRAHADELTAFTRAQAEAARAEAHAPRYDDLGEALKLKLVEGGEATVRKDRVASVELLQNGSTHAVVVDGHAIHVGTDPELARHHFDDVHEVIFPTTTPQESETTA